MRRRLLNRLTTLSLLLCVAAGGCSSHNAASKTHTAKTAESRDAPAARSTDLARPPDAAPPPDFRRRKPWLPSPEDLILQTRPMFDRRFEQLQRDLQTLDDPRATDEQRLKAEVGARVAKAELRRLSAWLIDLVEEAADSPAPTATGH